LTDDDQGRMWYDSTVVEEVAVRKLKVYTGVTGGFVDIITTAVTADAIKGSMIDWVDISHTAGALVVGDDPDVALSFNKVSVNVDDSTIEISSGNALQVKDGGITNAKLETNSHLLLRNHV